MIFFSSRAASTPFKTGMDKSRTIRAGRCFTANSTASCPLVDSAQTSYSLSAENISHNIFRINGLSSAIRIVFAMPGLTKGLMMA